VAMPQQEILALRVAQAGGATGIGLCIGATLPHSGVKFYQDPKILWAGLLWAFYLGLLISRWRFGQSGHRFAIGVIGAFAFLVLTFWGTALLSPLHHQ